MSKASKNPSNEALQRLELELSRLKDRFKMAQELKLEWMPDSDNKKSGEVLGTTVYISTRKMRQKP